MSDGSITIDTNLDQNGIKKGLGSLSSTLGKVGNKITSVFKMGATAITATSTAISGAIGYGAKYNATIEQYATSFEVMTGSAEKAVEVVEELKKIGAETPFEMTELADTTQLLMNYGFTADDAISKMKMLGDISQGSADKMNRISMAYGQMSSAGKVSLEDVKQMIEAGFNPLQEISQTTGESMESLYDRISKGTISVDEITASMERSTSVGGKYFQSMEKQSQTVSGQLSTLKDNASQLLGTLSEGFSNSLGGTILPMLNEMVGNLQQAFQTGGIEAFSAKLGEVLSTLMTNIANSLPQLISLGTTILQSLLQGIQQNLPQILIATSGIITNIITGIITMLPQLMPLALQILQTIVNTIIQNLPQIVQTGIKLLGQLITGIAQMLPELIPMAIDCIITLVTGLLDNIDLIIDAAIDLMIGLAMGLVEGIPKLIEKIPEIIVKIVEALIRNGPKIREAGIELIKLLAQGIYNMNEAIGNAVKGIAEKIWSVIKELPGKAVQWGKDMIQGFIDGIKNMIGNITGAVSGIAEKIKNFLHFSRPDTGPLREYEKWMPDMIKGLARTMKQSYPIITKASKSLSKKIEEEVNLNSIYNKMQSAIAFETGKISANLSTNATVGKVLTANITVKGDTYMDSTKVGRMTAPTVSKVLKTGGAF